jgi:integrase
LKKERDASDILLAEVLLAYWHQHASKLPSGKRIKASMRHLTEFFDGMTVKEACHPGQIELFVQAMLVKKFARTYINNLLGIIKAATQRAWKRGELAAAPFIELIEAQRKAPKGEPLKPSEIGSLLVHANKNTYTMIMLMMGTGCRPQAACEMTWEQIDFEHGLIDLNQEGRIQTAKYRPIVRIPPALRGYLLTKRKPSGLLISHGGRVIRRWETAWRNCRGKAGLGKKCNPYSIRHTVARWLRAKKVMKWEIENQLGHSKLSTTDAYAPHDPDYLADACAAIDQLMVEALAFQKREAA